MPNRIACRNFVVDQDSRNEFLIRLLRHVERNGAEKPSEYAVFSALFAFFCGDFLCVEKNSAGQPEIFFRSNCLSCVQLCSGGTAAGILVLPWSPGFG
jgi:hypothetical protein